MGHDNRLGRKEASSCSCISFEEDDPRQIRDKIFSELKLDELNQYEGMEKLIAFFEKLFKKDPLTNVYEHYINFYRFKRQSGVNMETYISEFEKL